MIRSLPDAALVGVDRSSIGYDRIFGGSLDEVKAQVEVGYPLVTPRERLPVEDSRCQSLVALGARSREQVGGFKFAAIDAISRNSVEVQIDVNAVLAA